MRRELAHHCHPLWQPPMDMARLGSKRECAMQLKVREERARGHDVDTVPGIVRLATVLIGNWLLTRDPMYPGVGAHITSYHGRCQQQQQQQKGAG